MQTTGFESDVFEDDVSADALTDVGEEGFEDGFEEGFEEDAFEEASDGFESEDGFEAEDGFEEDGLDAADAGGDVFEGEGADEIEDAFAEAMDAEDEDEFLRRLWGGMQRLRRVASPVMRRIGRRALPIGMRLLRQGARQLGGVVGQEVGGAAGGGLGGLLQQGLGALLGGGEQVDAMDAFADLAADEAAGEDEIDEFAPILAGMAGRYVVRNLTSAATRAARPAAVRALGRAVARTTARAARTIARRHGPRAVRAIPRLVRRVTVLVRRQGASPRTVPRMIQRAAVRVASSPRAAAQLARPSAPARRLRARAGVRPGAAVATPVGGRWLRGVRSIRIQGPARLTIQSL